MTGPFWDLAFQFYDDTKLPPLNSCFSSNDGRIDEFPLYSLLTISSVSFFYLRTPSIPGTRDDVLDGFSVKHWEYKSWITFKLLSLEMRKIISIDLSCTITFSIHIIII
jgi:hypothetical protein